MTDESTSEIRYVTADCPFCEREEDFDTPGVGRAWLSGHIQAEHSAQLPAYENGMTQEQEDAFRDVLRSKLGDDPSLVDMARVMLAEPPTQEEVESGECRGTDESTDGIDREELREELADLEHRQWIHWSQHAANNDDFPQHLREKWEANWKPYDELDDDIQEMDRRWARKVIEILEERGLLE